MNFIEKIPVPISGLILALFSLGNLLQDIHPYLRYLCAGIGAVFLILIVFKVILYPNSIKEDFKNPVIVSSSGTFSMSLMILSTYLQPFIPRIAYTIWIIGIVLHILLIIYFTCHFIIRDFNISNVYPTYWIVYVGITLAAITANIHGIRQIDFIFFIIGFIGMLITTPLVVYREFIFRKIPDMNKPLTCIFTALFSILIVGYLNSAESISNEFAIGLYIIAAICYIFALYKFIKFRNLDFYPSFAAFTFPFVISALATKGIYTKISPNAVLNSILNIEIVIATVLVIYVLTRYLVFLKNS
ncbi:MAG: TDT family transporter [Methanobrevibacter sp.]|uniref:TDT family transporter n=1 Tax=Methanobrevibacter sp. TaxID=66852 RepID=UPI0025CCE525|nr:TDT family transporter [Methanobrevibacter sp.]MBQ8018485.1 TDT family transporter [Methanobrevibacter sp.]